MIPNTEGDWIGTYGSQGYDLVGDAVSLPDYATVTSSGASTYTWTRTPTQRRPSRIRAITSALPPAWESSTSFTVDVNLTDGQAHNLTVYAVDFDDQGLNEQIQILSAATGAVLDTKTLWSFSGGVYLQWVVSGNILIKVTNLSGPDAVLSGLFFDPLNLRERPPDLLPAGHDDGGELDRGLRHAGLRHDQRGSSLPATLRSPLLAVKLVYLGRTTAAKPLEVPPNGGKPHRGLLVLDHQLHGGCEPDRRQAHDLELYFLDWDNTGRSEQCEISNAVTGAVLSTETVSIVHAGRVPEVDRERGTC